MNEQQNEPSMSEEAQNVLCTLITAAAATAVIFFLSSCVSGCDQRQSERMLKDQQNAHELKMEQARQGLIYVEKGSWIKPSTP